MSPPLASRCPQCSYLPASATVICPQCKHDRRERESGRLNPESPERKERMSKASKVSAVLSVLFAAGSASATPPEPAPTVAVPYKLVPPANETLALVFPAGGVQIYECGAKEDKAGQYEWQFIAPEADLYDAHGAKVGRHFAGPHWELADGSRVVGTVKERADAPSSGAIPWLLLSAESDGPSGAFSKVTSIQRVHTAGGVAPESGCSEATLGKQVRVNYTADYYFFTRKSAPAAVSRDFNIGLGD
jgi:hypothetical protein